MTVVGVLTLLLGGACVAYGGWLVHSGATAIAHPDEGPWAWATTLFGLVPFLSVVFGIAFLGKGALGLLAGAGG